MYPPTQPINIFRVTCVCHKLWRGLLANSAGISKCILPPETIGHQIMDQIRRSFKNAVGTGPSAT